MNSETILFQFQVGEYVMQKNLAGLSDAESLTPPQPGGNSLNWVVGHIVRARNQALTLLGETPLFNDHDFQVYGAQSFSPTGAISLSELQVRFLSLGSALSGALKLSTPATLEAVAPFSPTGNPNETVGSLLASIAFHEAYHLGQTGILRRMLGKPGAILAPGEEAP
ncbi:MAG: DinB family protein [Candidatus Hydrogenedentes bacterium]|nr:DinB family protein [Candidatus Hydrogenedentota bacterium]